MKIDNDIRMLLEDRIITDDLYQLACKTARKHLKDGSYRTAGFDVDELSEQAGELAGDFIVALASRDISGLIRNRSDLAREFKRWITRRDSPERSELWDVISATLRELETQGTVERPAQYREYFNSNGTMWGLARYAAKVGKHPESEAIAAVMPQIRAKGANDKILKPDEARAAVVALLSLYEGEVTMSQIFDDLSKHLDMLQISTGLDAPIGENDNSDNHGESLSTVIEDTQILDDYTFIVEEESARAATAIWQQADMIGKKGRPLAGRHILCCYLIPKDCHGINVTLQTFGATSSVQDVVKKLRAIMAVHLPVIPTSTRLGDYLALQVTAKVIQDISQLCSENGFCSTLYSNSENAAEMPSEQEINIFEGKKS